MADEVAARTLSTVEKVAEAWAFPIRHELDVIKATSNTAISELTMPEVVAWATVAAYTAGTTAVIVGVLTRVMAGPRSRRAF